MGSWYQKIELNEKKTLLLLEGKLFSHAFSVKTKSKFKNNKRRFESFPSKTIHMFNELTDASSISSENLLFVKIHFKLYLTASSAVKNLI